MNIRVPIIITISVIISSYTWAQSVDYGVVFWSKDRDLEWDDFKGKSLIDSTDNFYLDVYIQSANAGEMESFILIGTQPEAYRVG